MCQYHVQETANKLIQKNVTTNKQTCLILFSCGELLCLQRVIPSFQAEARKKKKYLQACLDQCRHFSPFVVSSDGLLGKKARYSSTLFKFHEVKDEHCNCKSYPSMHPRFMHLHANRANILCGKMEPTLACSPERQTTNIAQNT